MKKPTRLVSLLTVLLPLAVSNNAFAVDGLIEISQPTTISLPGSYILINDIVATNSNGIRIQADDVTLDLNGFTIIYNGASNFRDGIGVVSARNVEIRNGTVRGFTRHGIFAIQSSPGVRVINMRVLENNFTGIELQTRNAIIRGCTVSHNRNGVRVFGGSMIIDNVITNNRGFGIVAKSSAGYGGNVIVGNGNTVTTNPVEIAANLCETDTFCP